MRSFTRGVLLSSALLATAALAQLPPVSVTSVPYQGLAGGTAITFSSTDEGFVVLPLQFQFPYFGKSYGTLFVHVNGFVAVQLPSGCTGTSGYCATYSGSKIPSSTSPNGMIAPFWDDMLIGSGTTVSYLSTPTDFTVEWSNVQSFSSSSSTLTFKVTISSDGSIAIHHGAKSGSSTTGSGAVGYEDETGLLGQSLLATSLNTCSPANPSGCCSYTSSSCTWGDFVPDTLYTFKTYEPQRADLVPGAVTVSNLAEDVSGNLSFNVASQVSNLGLSDARNFPWNVYLSRDRLLSTDDLLVATGGPSTVPAKSSSPISGPAATLSAPDAGAYFVLLQVNPVFPAGPIADGGVALDAGRWAYVDEETYANNVTSSATSFVRGLDVVAQSISGPAVTGAGSVESVRVKFTNAGTQTAGGVPFKIYLGSTPSMDGGVTYEAFSGDAGLTGGQTFDQLVSVTMPDTVPNGDWYYVLNIDPAHVLTESTRANNIIASSAKVSFKRADIVTESVDFLDPVTGTPIRTARFGDPVQLSVHLSNQGGATARNFYVAIIISSDNALSLLSDTLAVEVPVAELAPGAPATIPFNFTLPMKDKFNRDFATGNYFFFAAADARGSVGESNETNNNLSVGPVKAYAPGPDLIVSTIQAPASAGVGETVPVSRSIRNVGNVDAPQANYRYYISPNNIITTEDLPLSIIGAGGTTAAFGTVTLAKGAADSASEMVRLPLQMTPGTYFIGCIVDPEGAVVELSESNNATASASVAVAGSSLHVTTTQVPDAVVGRTYLFRLSAAGENGASTWSVDETQGLLPVGLTLAADGLLSGTPTGAGGAVVTGFTAVVTNSGRTAATRLAMRVLPQTALLDVSTASLPPVINSNAQPYATALAAVGGVRPYTWRVAAGSLPGGLALSTDGNLAGTPRAGQAEGSTRVTFEVRDATGSTARRELLVRLVGAGSIVFRTAALSDAILGQDYAEDVAVQNLDGSSLAKPLTFTILGALPPGIEMVQQSEVAFLSGRPTQAGRFAFTMIVEDAKGRTDTMEYTIVVLAPALKIVAELPAGLTPGQQVTVTFSTFPTSQSEYRVASGVLPPGLSLGLDGTLSGTVAADGADGTWPFVVEAHDSIGNSGLSPFGLVVDHRVAKVGCSATAGGPSWWLFAIAGLLLAQGRRLAPRRAKGLGLVAALALVPTAARAQYTADGPVPAAFQPLPAGVGTSVSPSTWSGVSVPLPFTFTFFGTPVVSVSMSRYGYLALFGEDDASSTNQSIPHSSTFYPASIIAPWWDSTSAGTFKWATLGTAPNRIVVFEWTNVASTAATTARFSFQAILKEGTNAIRFAYGPTAPGAGSASIGVMRAAGNGVAAPGCGGSGTCTAADFPSNQAFDFLLPPDLSLGSISVDPTAYAGVSMRGSAVVHNGGGRSTGATVRFYLSTDVALDASDVSLGDAIAAQVGPGEDVTAQGTLLVPSSVTAGNYFVISVVDPDNQVLEQNETNNQAPAVSLTVATPKPDLTVNTITVPGTAAPGATIQVSRVLANVGNAPVGAFKYSYFISDNAAVTVGDLALSPVGSSTGLAQHVTDTATDTVTLPAGLVPGPYWLGVCVNYDSSAATGFALDEITWLNDCLGTRSPIIVSVGTLAVTSTTLPAATQYSPYGLRLSASGGDGTYAWELSAGALPLGLTLSPAGDLVGAPALAGSSSFTVKVKSAGLEKTQDLSLTVSAGNLPLVVVDQDLPNAEFGRAYQANVVAIGGKPPYAWSLAADAVLPVGIALAPDGHLEGRAQSPGSSTFTAEVTDSAGTKVSKELVLKVVNPTVLTIGTRALASGLIKHDYLQPLIAVGGKAPYTFSVTSFQQLAELPTQVPGPVVTIDGNTTTALPDSLGLSVENGGAGNFLRGVPKKAGLYQLMLSVVDANGTKDSTWVQLFVTYTEGLAITTLQLPDAFIGNNYQAGLSNNGHEVEGATYSLPCVQSVVDVGKFACADVDALRQIPNGITLSPDGVFGGGANGPEGVYSFLVQLNDANGRTDLRAMSIRVRPNIAASSGCAGAASAPSWSALIVAVALLGLRRRR